MDGRYGTAPEYGHLRVDDMLIFRVKGEESQIMQITKDDIIWRYVAAFGYAAIALTVIAAIAILLSIYAENSMGPIVATVCIVIVFTVVSNINVPIIDKMSSPGFSLHTWWGGRDSLYNHHPTGNPSKEAWKTGPPSATVCSS